MAHAQTAQPSNVRRIITLRPGETEQIVDEIEAALKASDRSLYKRGGFIISVGSDVMPTWDEREVAVQVIEERGDYALAEDIEAAASIVKHNKRTKKLAVCKIPMELIHTLKQRRHRLRLPTLVTSVNCPWISAGGTVMDEPGFYARAG